MVVNVGTCSGHTSPNDLKGAQYMAGRIYIKRNAPIFIELKLAQCSSEFTRTRLPEYLTRLDLHRGLCCDS